MACFIFLFISFCFVLYSSLIQHPDYSFPSFISLQKRTGHTGTSIEHSITSYSKIRHKPSYQGWVKQPSGRKRVLRAGKSQSQRQPPFPLLEILQKHQAINNNIFAEDLAQDPFKLCDTASVSVSPY